MFIMILRLFLLQCIISLCIEGYQVGRHATIVNNASAASTTKQNYQRTKQIVKNRSEFGRIVVLLCKSNCVRQRSQIPQWIRDINEEEKLTGPEAVAYHFHTIRQDLDFLNVSVSQNFPMLVYIIAGIPHEFNGDVNSRQSVTLWLMELNTMHITEPKDEVELDFLLDTTRNCSEKLLLFLNDEVECPLDHWTNIVRYLWMLSGVKAMRLKFPLSAQMNVVLFKRLPLLNDQVCRQMILIHQDSYSIPFEDFTPNAVGKFLEELIPESDFECAPLPDMFWNQIQPSLTDLQMIFFSGEYDLYQLEHNTSYILVGLTGGVAVVALGVSIFWGLQGEAFLK